jgi:outer membrane protein OmpA-like peptidoglycan-associated protein
MTLPLLLLLATAGAQEATDIGLPELNAQLWRPPVDGTHTLWTLDAGVAPEKHFQARALASYAMDPLVVIFEDGDRMDLVSDVLQLDLTAATVVGRFRLGLDVPVYLHSAGQLSGGGLGSGDVMLDVKGGILDRDEAPLGLAVDARLFMPTATVDLPLGNQGLAWELAAVADKRVGPVLLAANLGTRGVPEVVLENVTVNDQFFYRLGGGYELHDNAGISADLAGALTYGEGFANDASSPVEGILGGWGRVADNVVVRGGLGTGLSQGIGAPVFRALLSVGYEPPLVRDSDDDGLLDDVDACVDQPEDFDGWADSDGCPDPSTLVQVRLVVPGGELLADASAVLRGEAEVAEGGNNFEALLHPGAYRLAASAPGYRPLDVPVTVPGTGPHLVELMLEPKKGTLTLKVLGPDGEPIAASVAVDRRGQRDVEAGELSVELLPGVHNLVVQAPGYALERAEADIVVDQVTELTVQLAPTRVAVTREKIDILEKVYFDTGKDTIKAESFPLLDEIAGILTARDDILKVRIEGHTDERGRASTNQELSERRAASVLRYLGEKGVAADRLHSVGFGESKPVDPGHNEKAWDANRRVEFMIEAWAEES